MSEVATELAVVIVQPAAAVQWPYSSNKHGYKRKRTVLAVRRGKKHNVHSHKGLPAGVQILLPRWEEREGADALGGGEGRH